MDWAKLSSGVNFLSSAELHDFTVGKIMNIYNHFVSTWKYFSFSESVFQYPNTKFGVWERTINNDHDSLLLFITITTTYFYADAHPAWVKEKVQTSS